MSTFEVTVEELAIYPHSNADALELAQVGLYHSVVRKGLYQTGQLAVYIPEQAVLPESLIEELGLTGRLAGSQKNRVKPVKLRGELSQGIVFIPSGWTDKELIAARGFDLAEQFGITKYVPHVPAQLAGKIKPVGDTFLIRWTDIENIKKHPKMFGSEDEVQATAKIHGTCAIYQLDSDGTFHVASKGIASRGFTLEDDGNLYWKIAHQYDIRAKLERLLAMGALDGVTSVAAYGEIFGPGVQDLHYGLQEPTFLVFDLAFSMLGHDGYYIPHVVERLCEYIELDYVPVLYRGVYNYDKILAAVSVPEVISGRNLHVNEGGVIRCARGHQTDRGHRKIAKLVTEDYLLRKNGTEFE